MHSKPHGVKAVSTRLDLPGIWSHGVGGQDPAPLSQLVSQIKLGVLASFLLALLAHSLGQAECHQWQRIILTQDPEVPCNHICHA